MSQMLALTDLHARVLFINHVNAAFAAHNTAILVAQLGRLQRITDSHDGVPRLTLVKKEGAKYASTLGLSTRNPRRPEVFDLGTGYVGGVLA